VNKTLDPNILRELLRDKDSTRQIAYDIIEKMSKESTNDKLTKEMFIMWSKFIVDKNINEIHTNSKSPIETIFLSSVLFSGLLYDTRMFVFTPRNTSFIQSLKKFNAMKSGMNKLRKEYQKIHPNKALSEIDIDLLKIINNNCDKGFASMFEIHQVLYEIYGLKNSFHFTLQTFLENITNNGKRIKPDITIWVPENKKFKLIVECDGFKFHSNKTAFTIDRQKDRVLQRSGFQIHRYSGAEIYHNPVETAFDLCNYLFDQREKMTEK